MLCLQVEWAAKTHDLLERLWKLPISGQLGISLIPAVRLGTAPWPPVWRDVVFGCTGDQSYTYTCCLHTLCRDGGTGGAGYRAAAGGAHLGHQVPHLHRRARQVAQGPALVRGGANDGMCRLLPYLLSQFEAAGGEVVIKHVARVISILSIFQYYLSMYNIIYRCLSWRGAAMSW